MYLVYTTVVIYNLKNMPTIYFTSNKDYLILRNTQFVPGTQLTEKRSFG